MKNSDKNKRDKAFTIVHSTRGQEPETIKTGLSSAEARHWLSQKATEQGQTLSKDLIVKGTWGEVWSAVEAE